MTVGRGIVIGGVVQPGTDWILRDSSAWWAADERGTKPRTGPVDVLVGHWTASQPDTGPGAGPKTVRNMKARRRPDGTLMNVGIHFVIAWDGLVWQTCDLEVATIHVGNAAINARSIGVECDWPGTAAQASRLGVAGRTHRRVVAGSPVHVLDPAPEMIASWVGLADTLAAIRHPAIALPRQVPHDRDGALLVDRMKPKALRRYRGALEHLHMPTTKIDAAGVLVNALAGAGWRGVPA